MIGNDNPIADIRQLRHSISEEFGHNPKLYIEYLQKLHGQYLKQIRLYEELPNVALQSDALPPGGSVPASGFVAAAGRG